MILAPLNLPQPSPSAGMVTVTCPVHGSWLVRTSEMFIACPRCGAAIAAKAFV